MILPATDFLNRKKDFVFIIQNLYFKKPLVMKLRILKHKLKHFNRKKQ